MLKDLREEVRFVVAPCRRGVSPERLGVNMAHIPARPLAGRTTYGGKFWLGCPTHKGSIYIVRCQQSPIHRANALEWGLRQIGPLRGPSLLIWRGRDAVVGGLFGSSLAGAVESGWLEDEECTRLRGLPTAVRGQCHRVGR